MARLEPKTIRILFFTLLAIILLVHNQSISLWDQDEAAYAGFAKNMLETNDWLIPECMWGEIHRKPPLHFWNIAISYQIFGINPFAVRFPSALLIFLTYLFIYFRSRKLFGEKVAFYSTLVLSTSLLIPALGKISVTDGTLLFFSTLAGFALIEILKGGKFFWTLIFWTSFAFALLTKGPPILIFTVGFIGILAVFHPERKNLIRLHPWFFLPLALAPLFWWAYLTSKEDGGVFLNWMIDWYILKRLGGSVLGQSGPPGTHLLFMVLFFLPYLMFLPAAMKAGINGIWKKHSENIFLGAWFVAAWLPYELSPSKLPAYAVVAHVPLAILIGKTILSFEENSTRPHFIFMNLHFILFALLGIVFMAGPVYLDFSSNVIWPASVAGFALLIGTGWAFMVRGKRHFATAILSLNLVFQFLIWSFVLPSVDSLKNSSERIADYLENEAKIESEILISNVKGHPPSLPFYLSLHFKNISEERDVSNLLEKYQMESPFAFILTEEDKLAFEAIFLDVEIRSVQSFFTDRTEKHSYFILVNPAGRKI